MATNLGSRIRKIEAVRGATVPTVGPIVIHLSQHPPARYCFGGLAEPVDRMPEELDDAFLERAATYAKGKGLLMIFGVPADNLDAASNLGWWPR